MYNSNRKASSLWTVLYGTKGGGCYWIKIGHSKGPKISQATAEMLAKKFLTSRRRWLRYIAAVRRGGPIANSWKE